MTPRVDLARGYPELGRDVRRNLRRAARHLTDDGIREVIRFHPAGRLDGLHAAITVALIARNRAAKRPVDLPAWRALWRQAGEAATLHLDGALAAWELAAPDPPAYRVLAGQMVPGWERYRPGRLLEEAVIRRVLEDPAYAWIDWGTAGYADALIAVT